MTLRELARVGGAAAIAAAALSGRVGGLAGWRRRGLAALLGGLAALALPPLHVLPVLVVAFTGLIWLIDAARRPAAAFAVGWWFGFGYSVIGLYWIAHALLTDPEKFAWMIPFAVFGLAGVLAAFSGLAALLARAAWGGGPARVIVLAVAWTGLEWVRGWIFTGFPWNLIGSAWAFADPMNQFAALAGVWGLSLVTVAAAGMPAVLADGRPVAAWGAVAAAGLAIAGIWAGGALRLAGAGDETVAGVRLRLVQAAIDQRQKNEGDLRAENLRRHLRLTVETPGLASASHVIWPEAAAQFLLEREPELRAALAAAAPPGGALITGAPRGDPVTGPLQQVWNSLVAIDPAGAIVATYDKFHLVPWGEYVPFRTLFPLLTKITPGSMDFSAGPGPRTLRLPGLPPVGPLICYEAIFPGAVVDPLDRPDWLLNLTNDGWYGISSGPYQHFASARLRAVEEGMPLVRAANTGISGVVDAYGRVTARLGLGETGVVDADLPKPLSGLTPYARFGDAALAVLLGLAAVGAAALRRLSR